MILEILPAFDAAPNGGGCKDSHPAAARQNRRLHPTGRSPGDPACLPRPDEPIPAPHPPGERAAVVLFLAAIGGPKRSLQRSRFYNAGREEELFTSSTHVGANELVLRPPQRGGLWLAANGPDGKPHHRRPSVSYSGPMVVPQSLAIDFAQLNGMSDAHAGDARENSGCLCRGKEVPAGANAIISRLTDGIPENIPHPTRRAVSLGWETVNGNHVALHLGAGPLAICAHLQPGSPRVRTGDRVRTGEVLGLAGNSGTSTGPHLHFYVSGSRDLGSDGLPFGFNRFHREGTEHDRELPLRAWRIDFP